MWYRTGRGEGVSFCSSTVGECRPTWLWLPGIETWIRIRRAGRSALLGAWDERNGGSASGETRLVEVETKEDHEHRGLRGKASGRLGASAPAFGRGERQLFRRSGKCHHRSGRRFVVCVCVVPATRECERWIWICRWADSTTRQPEVDRMSSSLRIEMGGASTTVRCISFLFCVSGSRWPRQAADWKTRVEMRSEPPTGGGIQRLAENSSKPVCALEGRFLPACRRPRECRNMAHSCRVKVGVVKQLGKPQSATVLAHAQSGSR